MATDNIDQIVVHDKAADVMAALFGADSDSDNEEDRLQPRFGRAGLGSSHTTGDDDLKEKLGIRHQKTQLFAQIDESDSDDDELSKFESLSKPAHSSRKRKRKKPAKLDQKKASIDPQPSEESRNPPPQLHIIEDVQPPLRRRKKTKKRSKMKNIRKDTRPQAERPGGARYEGEVENRLKRIENRHHSERAPRRGSLTEHLPDGQTLVHYQRKKTFSEREPPRKRARKGKRVFKNFDEADILTALP